MGEQRGYEAKNVTFEPELYDELMDRKGLIAFSTYINALLKIALKTKESRELTKS